MTENLLILIKLGAIKFIIISPALKIRTTGFSISSERLVPQSKQLIESLD